MLRMAVALMLVANSLAASGKDTSESPAPRVQDGVAILEIVRPDRVVAPFKITHEDSPQFLPKGCWIEKKTLFGGKQDGVELITVSNGKLTITVVPTRGMSILNVVHADMELGWKSPVKEVVHPKFIDFESRGGLGWLEGFNEWMTRCGLEFAGHPGVDRFTNNTGDQAEMTVTLHGKIGNIPASQAFVSIEQKAPHRISIRGAVSERMFYGPKLDLMTEVSFEPGADRFRITDSITNGGAFDQEFQLIYHANYGHMNHGQPLLEAGSALVAATKSVTPMNAHAAKSVAQSATYAGPTKGFPEEVYLLEPLADAAGQTVALLKNAKGNAGTSLSWSVRELPYLTQWKNTAAEEDGYVTGIEPATGYPFTRRVERHFGRVPKLAPKETRSFTLEFGIHVGVNSVQAVEAHIQKLQQGHKVDVRTEPPVVPPLAK